MGFTGTRFQMFSFRRELMLKILIISCSVIAGASWGADRVLKDLEAKINQGLESYAYCLFRCRVFWSGSAKGSIGEVAWHSCIGKFAQRC